MSKIALPLFFSFMDRYGCRQLAKTATIPINIIVGIKSFSTPKFLTNGLIKYPALIPAIDPPIPIKLKSLLAWRGLNISPAKSQNCSIVIDIITSVQT